MVYIWHLVLPKPTIHCIGWMQQQDATHVPHWEPAGPERVQLLPEHALDVTWPDGQHLKSTEVVAMREGACVQKGSPGSRAKGQRCSTNWHGVAVA